MRPTDTSRDSGLRGGGIAGAVTSADAARTASEPTTQRGFASRWIWVGQLTRFGVVGVLGTVLNVAILHVLHTELGWGFTRSSAIATELAIVHNYMWNELWTFHIRKLDLGRLLRYQTSSLVAFCVTVGVATLAKEAIDPRLAQLVGILSGAGFNYAVNVRWTWGPTAVTNRTTAQDAPMLADTIQSDLHTAMKARDRHAVASLRMVLARIKEARTSAGHGDEVTDDEVQTLIRREAKRREEAAATYAEAGRDELEAIEVAELEVLRRYLPAELSDEALAAIIDEAIAETGATSASDFGRVMGAVMPKVKGQAGGGRVNALVRARLTP
ncbi:MAG TPA: GatB/YqeY domain-containing protein [Euzebyales bacterium]